MDARALIEEAGGLCTRAGLAQRWGITRQAAAKIVKQDGFPPPVCIKTGSGDVEAWFVHEADEFRQRR